MCFIISLSTAAVTGRGSGVAMLCLQPEVRWSQWPPLWEELWTSKWSRSLIEFPFILMNNSEFVKGRKSNFFFIWNTQFASPRTLSPRGGRNTAPHPTFSTTPQCIGSLYVLGIQQFQTTHTLQQRRRQGCLFGRSYVSFRLKRTAQGIKFIFFRIATYRLETITVVDKSLVSFQWRSLLLPGIF